MSKPRTTCSQLLDASCFALFEAYDIDLEKRPNETPNAQHMLLGFIGFTHDHMRGTVAIIAPQLLLDHSAQGACPKDWIGELANQLLGRLKNKLLGYDVALQMSTPIAMRGCALSISNDPNSIIALDYASNHGPLHVYMDIEITDGFELEHTNTIEEDLMDEGEFLFF